MRRLLVTLVIIFSITTGFVHAQQPFLPGQIQSQALAESIWHPPCAHVGISPLTPADGAPRSNDPLAEVVAIAIPGQCRIEASRYRIMANTTPLISIATTRQGRQRELKLAVCTVLVHEYGHLAGYYSPVGVPNPAYPEGIDHSHSPDPHNIMSPDAGGGDSYPPCRRVFPRRGGVRPAGRAVQR